MERFIARQARRIAILGWGNPARGDDDLGPAAIQYLERRRGCHSDWPELRLVAAHQLQVEHILDIQGCDLVLFIDASTGIQQPYAFRAIEPMPSGWSSHGFAPGELLTSYEHVLGEPAPRAFLLEIGALDFSIDRPLNAPAREHLSAATQFLDWALAHATREQWLAAAAGGTRRSSRRTAGRT
jgi:hydrogenase maturation protease